MPARPYVLAIVVFWMALTSWLVRREVWPYFRSGEPPPYTIDLADEARQHAEAIRWNILRGGKVIGVAMTKVTYRDSDDTFELHNDIEKLDLGMSGLLQVKGMKGLIRVSREGKLREIQADFGFNFSGLADVQAHVEGAVKDQYFTPRCRIVYVLGRGLADPGLTNKEITLDPIPVPSSVSVLNPLHPVNRIAGLRHGQHWRMPLVDPLRDAVAGILGTRPGLRFLEADVLPESKTCLYNSKDWPCLVVEFRGEDMTARIWIREADGIVLRHEATVAGDELVLERQ